MLIEKGEDNMEEEMDLEMIVMELITHAGDARSLAIEAIRSARSGSFDDAGSKMQEAEAQLIEAHNVQTSLLVRETNGDPVQVSLLLVHAQDHLMNAITVKDLALEMIAMMKENK